MRNQVRGMGLEPVQAEGGEAGEEGDAGSVARLSAELARLRKDNAQLLASKGSGASPSSNGSDQSLFLCCIGQSIPVDVTM